MKLTVTQKPKNGVFGGPKTLKFSMHYGDVNYDLSIEQCVQRTITIASQSQVTYPDILKVYYSLETLLMILEGRFYPVVSAFEDGIEITHSWQRRTLPSYKSADFMIGCGNVLAGFETVVNSERLLKWISLREELDIIHNMVLYYLSSVQMPKDMQCAFMTEAFEGLSELVSKRKPEIVFNQAKKGESQLKINLLTFITNYGALIFQEEAKNDARILAQILVDSRNRIAHIKSRQGRVYLDGAESVIYLKKMSLMYRIVLIDLLEIDESVYLTRLSSQVKLINEHDTMKKFLQKLGGESDGSV